MSPTNPYRGFRFPAEFIEHAVWLYHCFSLSLREVKLILAALMYNLGGWRIPAA